MHQQTEAYWGNVNPIGSRSCDDEGKRCAETLFFDYHRPHKLEITVARIFNAREPTTSTLPLSRLILWLQTITLLSR